METLLSPEEQRVLGCLIEKEAATPEYYPLTLNALVAACNQKNNRDPVLELDEATVVRVLDTLRFTHHLANQVTTTGNRVPKYAQHLAGCWTLTPPERAVLCELLLRGPQTVGELRTRTARLNLMASPDDVAPTLQGLASRDDGPFVVCLPREPGRKEPRWAHLLGGPVVPAATAPESVPEPARVRVNAERERLAVLETEVEALREAVAGLRAELAAFKQQFG